MKKLAVVADWSLDDLTCCEFKTALEGFLKDPSCPNTCFVSSTPSTVHTSYLVSQMIETEERYGRPHETIVFENTDPRLDSNRKNERAKGAEFIIAKLTSGIIVCGPNAGYNFSLFKDKIEKVYTYSNLSEGSQFRSRDLYARVCAHLMDNLDSEMEFEEVEKNIISTLHGDFVGHVDNYGNIKTTVKKEQFKGKYELGDKLRIKINNVEKEAVFVTNLFGGEVGNLVIYPGSSGPKGNSFLEVSVWSHFNKGESKTGAFEFNYPKPGMEIEIE